MNATPPQFSFRQANKFARKLAMRSGDILLIRSKTILAEKNSIDAIIKAFERIGLDGLILVVDDFNDLKVIDEAEMNKHGWYHIDHLKKLLVKPKPAGGEKADANG